MVKVLVVDDHELVRTGICRMLADHPDIEVVGQADSGEMAIDLVRRLYPDVVFHDGHPAGTMDKEATTRPHMSSQTLLQIHYGSLESEKLRQH